MVNLSQWLEYIENQIGFILPSNQHRWVENAIQTAANEHQLTVAQLWIAVQRDAKIKQALLDAVLILESRFFRHKPSIAFITRYAKQKSLKTLSNPFTQLEDRQNNANCFSAWSIGCSEGQEVWSLAMSLAQAHVTDFHILGTDISTKAIESAQKAIYETRYLVDIPNSYQSFIHMIDDVTNQHDATRIDKWQVSTKLHDKVTFQLNNIFLSKQNIDVEPEIKHDVIICQNMLIYFRQFDRRDILNKMVNQCKLGGYVVLAPGEEVSWRHPFMQRIEDDQVNAWQKITE